MKSQNLFILIMFFLMFGCSENSLESKTEISDAEKKAFSEAHERIIQNSVLADFINRISNNDFEKAIVLLHPKLKEAWTLDRFTQDWKKIQEQLSEKWGPEATGSFTGKSPQGPYEQATYRLSSDWRSLSSIDLVSMKNDGREYIVRVHLRVPYRDNPPNSVIETSDQLVILFFNEKYNELEELMTLSCKQQFPAEIIKKIRPVLGNNESKIEKNYYRFFANTVWYDAVRLNQSGDGFTFIEFILLSENNRSKVATLTFRGAMN